MGPHHLDQLFSPASIAIFGIDNDQEDAGFRVLRNLQQAGYSGDLYPINPKEESIQDLKCYQKISQIESPVDLAIIKSPAKRVVHIIRECGEQGVKAAVVLSSGFRETGPAGARLEQTLLETAQHYNIRIIGPNCLGLMRPSEGLDATYLDTPAPKGGLALVSQSGALCNAIVDWAKPHQVGFSAVVSLGNATDLDFGDILDYLAADYRTNAILLYIEGIHDARAFMSGLRTAARSKPVIVLKVGRHADDAMATSTHTGAMIGSDDVFDAALQRAGVVRAMTFGQLFAAAEILSSGKKVHGNRLAIVTNGGGPGILATDRAHDLGVEVANLQDETIQKLNETLKCEWSRTNPVDIPSNTPADKFGAAMSTCLAAKEVDAVLALMTPQVPTDREATTKALIEVSKKHRHKPVLACWMGETQVAEARKMLSEAHIPNFLTPERAVEAFSYLAQHSHNQKLLLQTPGPLSDARDPDIQGARLIMESALADGRDMLTDIESKAILSAFHIPCTPTIATRSPTEALVAAESVGFPVAMKVMSPDIIHKSDVGGVRINVSHAPDVRSAYKHMMEDVEKRLPDARLEGISIEHMARSSNGRELMVGVKRDPVFGPVISFGSGGTTVEILRDSAVALPPLNHLLARRLIERTKVARLLAPFRQMPAVNLKAIEQVLLRVSEMVCELPHVVELDINPLFSDEHGVIAADVRIRLQRPSTSPVPYAHMAIHPYPSHLVSRSHLPDGTVLTIRPIRPEDADIEQEFVRNMSSEAKYYRFMQTLEELTPEMLARFTQPDYDRETALIAVIEEQDKRIQLGVARYTVNPDNRSCEFALAVSDSRRRMGIGSQLMEALMESARNRGLKMIEGEVLSDNQRMLSLMRRLGFAIRNHEEDTGLKIVERWL